MGTKEKPKYYISRLNLYEQCPHANRVVYLEGVPRSPDETLDRGGQLHELVAQYLERLIADRRPTDWEWARLAVQGTPPMRRSCWRWWSWRPKNGRKTPIKRGCGWPGSRWSRP